MLRFALIATILAAAPGAALAQTPDEAFLDTAYKACVSALHQEIKPTGSAPVEFAARERVQMVTGGEFRFAFSSGTISGADTAEPHRLTMMTKPAASCAGIAGVRTLNIVLNGEPLKSPVKF